MEHSPQKQIEVSAIIPAYNEAKRIAEVVRDVDAYVDEVLVIDDGSTDDTALVAESAGARIFRQDRGGYIAAVKKGFREAAGRVVVTIDGDGEHRPDDIPRLTRPISATVTMVMLSDARPETPYRITTPNTE